ncbi:hypothetical protein BGZ81_002286, partial [Podila clonocystis]
TLTPKVADVAYFDTMGGRGDFHSARIAAGIDVSISGSTATVTVTLPKAITDLTLKVPTAWAFASSTVGVKAAPGAIVLLNQVAAGTVKLTFKTSGTVANPVNPAPGSTKTTTTINLPSPTLPPPTPTPATPRIVEDFSNPQRYGTEKNALGFYVGDDGTVASRTTVQADFLLLNVTSASYWYTFLGDATTCNDYSAFTQVNLAVRFPVGKVFGFDVVVQDADATGCTTLVRHPVNVKSLLKTPVNDGWYHLDLPLSGFAGLNATRLKSVSLSGFEAAGLLEVNYVQFS